RPDSRARVQPCHGLGAPVRWLVHEATGRLMRRRIVAAIVAAGCCASCDGVEEVAVLDVPICRVAQPPVQLALELSETSGIAVSRGQEGVLWTHTDSGTEPVLYALDGAGRILARVPIAVDTAG